ncbi:MAG TPA: uroporphyrinogen decarboxylase family protein [Capsulimonadaceae bacterium]|jgi:uroporphyrinogen decarboxylase
MNKRDIIKTVLDGKRPPYVPWSFSFTLEAREKLAAHFGGGLDDYLDDHFLGLGSGIGSFTEVGPDIVRDVFGVEWDRSQDKDIGIVCNHVLPEPTLDGYTFPNAADLPYFREIPGQIERGGDRFRVYSIGFSLYERAWTLRGTENLMMDFYDNPEFVDELFNQIAEYNLDQIRRALEFDIDAVYFGDDWGQQRGLQMGRRTWMRFIYPVLQRMYAAVRSAGKYVLIHSCGDVDEVFDDLIDAGLNCFNPFQPEVMDVHALINQYRGRLAFHGGLSTQNTLPYGTVDDVIAESKALLETGAAGGYIFSPAHAVEGDVSLENMIAFIETARAQPGYR